MIIKVYEIFLSIMIILLAGFIFFGLLYPAHISYISVCHPEQFAEQYEDDYDVVGYITTATITIDNESTTEVIQINVTLKEKNVYKHELIHVNQIERGFNPSCNQPLRYILFESEAYLGELYPDWLYNFIYQINIDEEIEKLN